MQLEPFGPIIEFNDDVADQRWFLVSVTLYDSLAVSN
jgi:hypothetical protein